MREHESSSGTSRAAYALDDPGLRRVKRTGFKRVILAGGASWRGLVGAFRDEAAFRQELALAALVIPLGLWLGRTAVERALLVAPMLNLLIVELINTAIEAVVDRIGLERNPLAGLAKDIGSAAVFMSFVLLGTLWLIVLWGH
ncbi:MAG TPA: diacylglycerol kinase [Steroidobacteraceae bacterium]|nr:diacylglycerol kinase [Steroidobacteraceae bacterium]HUN74241.1 diacylglycerol kinase [Steroidobacteraceae bacterium]